MISQISFFLLTLACSQSFIVELSQDYQILTQQLSLESENFVSNKYFTYGLWSKYLPLGSISQIGRIGIFDSNCYHLHNITDSLTKNIDLIYFDCIDYDLSKITKGIQFFDSEGRFHSYDITLDQWEYESHWYFIQIAQWPYQQRFELLFIKYPQVIYSKVLQINFPFKSVNPLLTFGGGLILQTNDFLQNMKDKKYLSYFPGKLYCDFVVFEIGTIDRDGQKISIDTFGNLNVCNCQQNLNTILLNQILNWLDVKLFTSENINCASFGLQGWLKIKEIHQIDDIFNYKFMKMNKFSQNKKLNDDNLSAFQLVYKILNKELKLLIMTYSYKFPSVNIDNMNNPYLIVKEIDILNNIELWHNLQVNLLNNILQIKLRFYEGDNVYLYQESINVHHFNEVQFQINYGNINQEPENYLNIQIQNFNFYNCNTELIDNSCHPSCDKCDGPTNSDCLSCSPNSNRIYIPSQKACICQYNAIDQDFCYQMHDFNLQLFQSQQQQSYTCEYGYFLSNSYTCIQCPSIIKPNLITCLECILNPLNWKDNPYCQQQLYIIADNTYNILLDQQKSYFILTLQELYLCQDCDISNLNDDLLIYKDFQNVIQIKKQLCYKNYQNKQIDQKDQFCYNCQISLCKTCVILLEGIKCLACDYGASLKDGKCNPLKVGQDDFYLNNCVSPYYRTSNKQCKVCPIKYCKFCFEYESNDLTKSTLYKDYEEFEQDDHHKVGCALCEDNFIFDFQKGLCLHQKSKIQYCQRSFINLEGVEICTLSQIDDFNIAPEFFDCQKYITNCLQCVLSPQQIIKCVVCKDGFKNSVISGHCNPSSIPYCKICTEGISNPFDAWIQLIQSFMMQFFPNQYYYYVEETLIRQIEITIECLDGFKLTSNQCFKTCESDCLQCDASKDEFISVQCTKCPLNYYRLPNRSNDKGICLVCPQLCQNCQIRPKEEILLINPEFIINERNVIFTYKCLTPAPDLNIKLHPQLQIAQYCFNNNCQNYFQYEYFIDCLNILQGLRYGSLQYYESFINKTYLNNMGLEVILINFNISPSSFLNQCIYVSPIKIDTSLKQEVFALQKVKMKMTGQDKINTKFYEDLIVQNFDVVEIQQMQFYVKLPFSIKLNNKLVTLIINETIFQGGEESFQSQFQIKGQIFEDFTLQNVKFQDLQISESTIININYQNFGGIIIIQNLQIINCTFANSSFIQFTKSPANFIINNLQIIDCYFSNSSLLQFFDDDSKNFKVSIQNCSILDSTFYQSIVINNPYDSEIVIQGLNLYKNSFLQSTIIACNFEIIFNRLMLSFNYFADSFFLISSQVNQMDNVNINFDDVNIDNNQISNSSIIKISSNLIYNSYKILLSNLIIVNNSNKNLNEEKNYLFNIQAQTFGVTSLIIRDCPNQNIFYLFQTQDIILQNILFTNNKLQSKVPLSLSCLDQIKQNQQLLEVQGFQNLKLFNISVRNHFNIDKSFIQIFSKIIHQSDLLESISIQNLTFQSNILLKKKIGNLLSLIVLYSEQAQIILISNMNFIENMFNQYSDDLSSSSSSLFYINTILSEVILQDCLCYNNMLTNSFNSFSSIYSNNTLIQNFTIKNLNIINENILKQYYQIKLPQSFTQDEILLIIKSYLIIQNKGGAIQITASNFTIRDSSFENILASSSAVFDIKTKFLGMVKIIGVTLRNIQVDFTQNQAIYGSITIYSQNSQLQLELTNVNFINVYNKFGPSSLTIFPSLKQNKLLLKNIYLENSLSLMNSFTKIEVQQHETNLNNVIIQNMTIIQTIEAWMNYFAFVGTFSIIEMLKILYDNAIINIYGCSVKIIGLNVQGVLFSSVVKIIDAYQFQLVDANFISVSSFLSNNIIYIGQDKLDIVQAQIFQIQFNSFTLFEADQYYINVLNLFRLSDQFSKCSLVIEKSDFIQSNHSIKKIINQLNQQQKNIGSMIFIQSLSNQTKIVLQSLKIQNNYCQNCDLGLVYIEIQNYYQIKMKSIFCFQNSILKYGCITLKSNSSFKSSAIIQNSQFITNNGSQGTGIFSQNINLKISNCIFLKNQASFTGGGLYITSNSNQFKIIKSIVMENLAESGGGMYLNGNNNLNDINFNQSILQLNLAHKNCNNLIEIPDHLGLQINNQEMGFNQSVNKSVITNTLQLKSYQTIQQGKKIQSNYLMIPSNQQMGNYGLFNMKEMEYFYQIKNITLSYRNSMNELLNNVYDSMCEISQTILSLDGIYQREEKFLSILSFSNQKQKFDLGTQIFQFDPYQNYDQLLKIQIDCILSSSYKQLRYQIYAKSYLCQLGEYYISKGCQKCQSTQGYYSVTYNATKCSIFDNTKFQNITSNLINLNPGYWRPNYYSDLTELCFKNQRNCQGGWGVGNKLCLTGHIGGLCEECDIYNVGGFGMYFKSQANIQCFLCPKESINILLFIFVTLWSFLSIFLSVRSIEKTNQLYSSLSLKQKFRRIIFKLNQDHQSFLIKMLLNYLWIFSLIYSFNINFSFSITFFESASNASLVLANSLDCYLSSKLNTDIVYSRIITMIILILFQFLFFILTVKLYSKCKRQNFRFSVVTNTILYLYISNYAILIKMFYSLLAVRRISNINFVQGNVSLLFYTQIHFQWILWFILPGVILFGAAIPVFLYMLMYFRKQQLERIQFRRHICYLFNEYNQNTYFWEQIKIWNKNLIIVIMIYFETNILLKASLLGFCLLLYQSLALRYRPFILKSLNILDISSSQICSFSIFLAAVQYVSDQQNQFISYLLQIILILLWIKLCKPFIQKILRIYYKKYRIVFLTSILNCLKIIKQNSCLVSILNKQILKWKTKEKQIQQNYGKLKMYLINFSRLSQEQHKNMNSQLITIQTLRSRISFQENETKQLF